MMMMRTAEAVADSTEGRDALLLEAGDDLVEGWTSFIRPVVDGPLRDVARSLGSI